MLVQSAPVFSNCTGTQGTGDLLYMALMGVYVIVPPQDVGVLTTWNEVVWIVQGWVVGAMIDMCLRRGGEDQRSACK